MADLNPSVEQMLSELGKVRHLIRDPRVTHPRNFNGPNDYGGLIENMEWGVAHGWTNHRPKQIAWLQDVYDQVILGKERRERGAPRSEAAGNPVPGDGDSFVMGHVGGRRSSEGWRMTIDGVIIGSPITREHAYIIGDFLKGALSAIERYYTNNKPSEVAGVQEATAAAAIEDTNTAERIEEI